MNSRFRQSPSQKWLIAVQVVSTIYGVNVEIVRRFRELELQSYRIIQVVVVAPVRVDGGVKVVDDVL